MDLVINEIRGNYAPRIHVGVSKEVIPHPEEYGLKPSICAPKGQIASYRIPLEDCSGIHILEYDTYYAIHWDEKDPSCDLIGHFVYDAPAWGIVTIGAAYYGLTRLN